MNGVKRWVLLSAALLLVIWVCSTKGAVTGFGRGESGDYLTTAKRDILCLMMAYPDYITGVEEKEGKVYLVMKSGKSILYDDGENKTYEQKLANPDLQDSMEDIYPLGSNMEMMPEDFDPGRIRHYELLHEVYGSSRTEIESNLTAVKIGHDRWVFNSSNEAAISLQLTAMELEKLSQTSSEIGSYLFPVGGTYNYRVIGGTRRLSAHAFGIAIDLAPDRRDYWRWASRQQGEERLKAYPPQIVEAFEKNNFIWGGKWGHFDIMHYEYRPEIILKARYFQNSTRLWGKWYYGFPYQDEDVKKYINIIEKSL